VLPMNPDYYSSPFTDCNVARYHPIYFPWLTLPNQCFEVEAFLQQWVDL
jgi:hypothetical protein